MVEAQTHRRFLKTHLPLDALVFSPEAKYIYIGRDGRDVVWSMYNHHANANGLWYEALNDTPGRVGPPIEPPPADIRQYFRDWMDRDGHPFWPFWENVRTWWEFRASPQRPVRPLRRTSSATCRERCAASPSSSTSPSTRARWEETLEYCSFDWMKRNAAKSVPLGGAFWDAGAQVFINKGYERPLDRDPHARGRGRVRSARRGGARPRMRAMARDRRRRVRARFEAIGPQARKKPGTENAPRLLLRPHAAHI